MADSGYFRVIVTLPLIARAIHLTLVFANRVATLVRPSDLARPLDLSLDAKNDDVGAARSEMAGSLLSDETTLETGVVRLGRSADLPVV